MINNKILLAILVIAMLLASGCVSVIKTPGSDDTSDDIATDIGTDNLDSGDTSSMDTTADEDSDLPTKTVKEGEKVSFPNLKAVDPDGDPIEYTFSEPLDEDGEWQTETGDAGKYTITITASDGTSTVSQDVLVIVKSLNSIPVMEELDDITIEEGEKILLNPIVSDPDGDDVEVSFSSPFDENGEWSTAYGDAGSYDVLITATDGKDEVKQTIKINVGKVNRAPILDSFDDIEIEEGEMITVLAAVEDPDGDDVEVSFSEPLNEDGEWQTEAGDAGKYRIKVTATDGDKETTEAFYVTVASGNKAPVFEGIADIEVDEGDLIELEITAIDPEGEDVEISYSLPLNEEGVWQTGYESAGEYDVTVTATDGVSEAEETFTVTVNDYNRPPTFLEGAFD